jgi:hypothetical protein
MVSLLAIFEPTQVYHLILDRTKNHLRNIRLGQKHLLESNVLTSFSNWSLNDALKGFIGNWYWSLC